MAVSQKLLGYLLPKMTLTPKPGAGSNLKRWTGCGLVSSILTSTLRSTCHVTLQWRLLVQVVAIKCGGRLPSKLALKKRELHKAVVPRMDGRRLMGLTYPASLPLEKPLFASKVWFERRCNYRTCKSACGDKNTVSNKNRCVQLLRRLQLLRLL